MTEKCTSCNTNFLQIAETACQNCREIIRNVADGPVFLRLNVNDLHFIEQFVLASGSLKQMAQHLDVTVSTVRERFEVIVQSIELMTDGDSCQTGLERSLVAGSLEP